MTDNQEIAPDEKNVEGFFSYYRGLRPHLFSDTVTTYDVPLTKELFDLQLAKLSTDKKQSLFENFIIRLAKRLIAQNIKPQTGPDGGGDGKVDGETYEVSKDIPDKWYTADSCKGGEPWAIAISVKKTWKEKVEHDVSGIVGTGRKYSKVLFFSNQLIKGNKRLEAESELKKAYGIEVSIFDGNWCKQAVFSDGCLDIALEELNFSEEYRRSKVVVGPNDRERGERLAEVEKEILDRVVTGLDTEYVDLLLEAALLSRGLERPRVETEGRFQRAMRECEVHGTSQQKFNIVYNHGWTSFFWFKDVDATYKDYLLLKEYVAELCNVFRVEKLTNLLTNLENVSRIGLFGVDKLEDEVKYIKELRDSVDDAHLSSRLYLDIYIIEHRIFGKLIEEENIDKDLLELEPLLLQAANHVDIGFESQYDVLQIMGKAVKDNQAFDDLVDKIAAQVSKRRSEAEGARIHLVRGMELMENGNDLKAIRQFGFCVNTFEKEGCEEELTKSCGMLGMALFNQDLPYSAEAYLVKAASLLIRDFYSTGNVPHLLITVLKELCKIELFLGRLVMYLNWNELLQVLANNAQENESRDFIDNQVMMDGSWACRFANEDFSEEVYAFLPDILDRNGLPMSADFLRSQMGYEDQIEETLKEVFDADGRKRLLKQPVNDQFLADLNIAREGQTYLETTARNCGFRISYVNQWESQIIAETFLAAIESLLSTLTFNDIVIITPQIEINLLISDSQSEVVVGNAPFRYDFHIHPSSLNDSELWRCVVTFLGNFFVRNAMTREDVMSLIEARQESEAIMDRVSSLMRVKQSIENVLGRDFKCTIEQWRKSEDKLYPFKGNSSSCCSEPRRNVTRQQDMTFATISSDMSLWDDAHWTACSFMFGVESVPAIFGLAFRNFESGAKIVQEWKELADKGELNIVIYIITGIDQKNPYWYRVCVAPDMDAIDGTEQRYVAAMCRRHTMTPKSDTNLKMFKEYYRRFAGCWFMALELDENNKPILPESFEGAFKFTRVEFRNAWEISLGDKASMALEADDDIFIPDKHKNDAPVLEVMKMLKDVSK